MLKTREIVMVVVLLVVLSAGAYYLFYLQPTLEDISAAEASIARKQQEVIDKIAITKQYEAISDEFETVEAEWTAATLGIPSSFDEADVASRYQKIIFTHTRNLSASFPSDGTAAGSVSVYSVNLGFRVTYDQLIKILTDFKDDGLASRVVNYSAARQENEEEGTIHYAVNMQVDYLIR